MLVDVQVTTGQPPRVAVRVRWTWPATTSLTWEEPRAGRRGRCGRVVAVIGSTEESAIDPIEEVLAVRDEFRARGLAFTVHADAAWGGYPSAMVRPDWGAAAERSGGGPGVPVSLSRFSRRQLEALGRSDSITLDPHKSGYIPYPAGALCYRNSAMRDLVTFAAPVVFHGDAEPTVGIYGVGSDRGAAPASVYLSHRVIPPSQSGYGYLIGQTLFSAEQLYVRLLTMYDDGDQFRVVPVSRLPAEVDGGDADEQMKFLRERINHRSYEEIMLDSVARDLLGDLGPDLEHHRSRHRRPRAAAPGRVGR